MWITHLPPSSGEATTCDRMSQYYDNGRACAWKTFQCDNSTIASTSLFPTCFDGSQQSPINLDKDQATVGDPGQITFSGFDTQLPETPIFRLKSYALQLDFKQTIVTPVKTTSTTTTTTNTTSIVSVPSPQREGRQADLSRGEEQLPTITGGALGNET